jgi:hypothetical protein
MTTITTRRLYLLRALVVLGLVLGMLGPIGGITSVSGQGPYSEDFNAFTVDQRVGSHADWYDGGGGPFIRASNGVAGSRGLEPAANIFTWVSHEFDWNDGSLTGVVIQMDFETDGSGHFDDDRVGWMIADDSVDSDYIFGVQMDPASGFRIEGYWDHEIGVDTDKRPPIVSLPALSADAWYQLRAEFTRLSAASAKIDVELWSLDGSGNPDSLAVSGSIADTSALGGDSPDPDYFTGPMWPAYKNYQAISGAADNAWFEIQERFAFVVISDSRTLNHPTAFEADLLQVQHWINNPTADMPAPQFVVFNGDFDHSSQTDGIMAATLGADFPWFPVIGNHEIDDINDFYYVRDTMFPSLPWIVNSGPPGSVGTSYSWDYGNAHFVVINCYWDGTTNPGADHATSGNIPDALRNWISADLVASGETHEFSFVHEPAYPEVRHVGDSLDQYPANRDAFVIMLDGNGVEALFVGHDHYYHHDVAAEYPLLGDMHQVDSGQIQGPGSGGDGSTIVYVLVDGSETTYKVYRSTTGYPFTFHEQWTIESEPPTEPPAAPTDLNATAASYSRIDLAWTDNADNEANFEIERSTGGSGGPFSPLETVAANTEAYANTGLDPETEYCYRVRATNGAGNSGYTNIDCATTPVQQPPPPGGVCEGFETGYTDGAELRTHADWFYGSGNDGPNTVSTVGFNGGWGLTDGDRIFTWVAHPFDWNGASFQGIDLQMDFQTDGSGHFDDDRLGWMISNTSDSSSNIFGVQMDPGGSGASGYNIEGYWDGVSTADVRPSIVNLPALSADTWYRLRAEIRKLTATSASIDVELWSLDSGGNPVTRLVNGSIADTSALGANAPNSKYFTPTTMWPAYKNYTTAAAPADNACFEFVTGPPTQHTLIVNEVGNGSVTKNPDESLYDWGTVVELTAMPDTGWMFSHWSGGLSGSDNPDNLTITGDTMVTANFVALPIGAVCEDFETGYTLGSDVGDHVDWFDGADNNGSDVQSLIGVNSSIGLAPGQWIFTWVDHPFDWNAPGLLGIELWLDFETDGSGHFDDDRLGWMIRDDDNNSDYIFGVQMDPGGSGASGYNIEAYWDGDTFGDNDGRTSIVNLPALTADTWYRLWAEITRLSATSASIDVSLTQLDGSGNPVGAPVAVGSIADTDALPDTAGEAIPNPAYFTGPIWPAYKNYNAIAGAADNTCFELGLGGSITIVKEADPEGDQEFDFIGDLGVFSLTDDGTSSDTTTFPGLASGTYTVTETIPTGWDLVSIVCDDPDVGTTTNIGTGSAVIDLDLGEDITCTFGNRERGSITIVKEADPEGDQEFDFTGDLGAFSLTDDGTSSDTTVFTNEISGTYSVAETVPAGWKLESIVCDDPDVGTTVNVGTASALIDLDPGEDIICTFGDKSYVRYFPLGLRKY